jgi:hypothetical protein
MQSARDPQSGRTKVVVSKLAVQVGLTLPADPAAS